MQQRRPVRRALLSASGKVSVAEFAQVFSARDIELLSTGGTARLLADKGLPVTEVSDYTGLPEMMGGRVETLHPKVHDGILSRRGQDDGIIQQHGITPIDMVAVNLYPFAQTVAREGYSLEDVVENTDIGGLIMVRSTAKNHKDVAIVAKGSDYDAIINEMDANGGSLTLNTRFDLAIKAFEHTAAYDSIIANYFGSMVLAYHGESKEATGCFPRTLNLNFIKKQGMRHGENSHQQAAFYIEESAKEASVATATQLQGKALSYNSIADTDVALERVKEFNEPVCVIVKHANPCGVVISDSTLDTYDRAYKTDPIFAFGGIIALNRELDAETAQAIISRQFVEVIIAPSASEEAPKITIVKQNIRVLVRGQWGARVVGLGFKRVNGGLLAQDRDLGMVIVGELCVVSKRQPSEQGLHDAPFYWKVAKFVKSNAIVYAKDNMTIGIGAGWMSRVYSTKTAGTKIGDEGLEVKGSAMASDVFFPSRDGIDAVAAIGTTCVIQPGGSIRDEEVITAADEHGIAMIFTDMRHFRHQFTELRMKVLVISNGGRGYALARKAVQSPLVDTAYIAPGNASTTLEPSLQNVAIGVTNIPALLRFAQDENIDLTTVGPEAPLVIDVVDTFRAAGPTIFGSTESAAQLEGSKAFAKDFLARHRIPTAEYQNFTKVEPALAYLQEKGAPTVIKTDGLAAGKGVIVVTTLEEAGTMVKDMLTGSAPDDAGHRIVIEELLDGEEASSIVMVDGKYVLPMATSQDHKRIGNGDTGPNIGGVDVYFLAPVVTDEVHQCTMERITWSIAKGMAAEGDTYTGFLYAGLTIDKQGNPKVTELNCRFSDPKTRPIMLRMKSDPVDLCLVACAGRLDEKTFKWDSRVPLSVVVIAGGYPGDYSTGDEIFGLPQQEAADGKVFHAGTKLADGQCIVANGGRVLCVTALGETAAQVQQCAYQLLTDIRWDGSSSRNDINWRTIECERANG